MQILQTPKLVTVLYYAIMTVMTDVLRDIFATNRVIILSIYGQVFFTLGVALALQSWQHSRLALARHLKWLAAFGLTHGLHEWGDVFIPIQAQYVAEPLVSLMLGAQLLLLAVSFACLFQFGMEMMRPLPNRWHFLRYLPGAILALWLFWTVGPAATILDDADEWFRVSNALARYSLGFLGALLAAYGLQRQVQTLAPQLNTPHIWRILKVAGLALVGYSLAGGLIVPEANFFPASWVNAELFQQVAVVPIQVVRSLLGLILAVTMIRALEVFQVEMNRQLSQMEETQILLAERERIGRELHDGTLQSIYAAGLLIRTTEKEITSFECPNGIRRLNESIELLDGAVTDIRGHIGMLRPQPNTRSLVTGLKELVSAGHLRSLVEVNLALNLPEEHPLPPTSIGHLLAITNEALSNVARHAQASHVNLTTYVANNQLHLEISDDGQGLPADVVVGYGLRNMRDRARILGGDLDIDSGSDRGTTVKLRIPWRDGYAFNSPSAG